LEVHHRRNANSDLCRYRTRQTPEQLPWFVEDVIIRKLQGIRRIGR